MEHFTPENIRMDPDIGDGVGFTADVSGVAHRFFISRQTLGELEHSLLTDNHDMFASFSRQAGKIDHAIAKSLKLGTSSSIAFLTLPLFDRPDSPRGN